MHRIVHTYTLGANQKFASFLFRHIRSFPSSSIIFYDQPNFMTPKDVGWQSQNKEQCLVVSGWAASGSPAPRTSCPKLVHERTATFITVEPQTDSGNHRYRPLYPPALTFFFSLKTISHSPDQPQTHYIISSWIWPWILDLPTTTFQSLGLHALPLSSHFS